MAGKPEDDDVPILVSSDDEDTATERLSTRTEARRRRRRERRRRRKERLRPGDVRRQEKVSDATTVAAQAVDSTSDNSVTSTNDDTTREEVSEDATAESTAAASGQNSAVGHVTFDVPQDLQCDISLFTFGEWVQIVKEHPHMIYYADDLENSPLVPYNIVQQQTATVSAARKLSSTDDESYVTCIDPGEAMPQVDGVCDVRSERAKRWAWCPDEQVRLARLEEQDRAACEQSTSEFKRRTVRWCEWLLFHDDCVMVMKKNGFTKTPMFMGYDGGIQHRLNCILKKLYTREHLLRSVGNEKVVNEIYDERPPEHIIRARLRLNMVVPPMEDPLVRKEIKRVIEFELRVQGKYLGGMLHPTIFSCPEELWYTHMQGKLRM